MSDHKKTVWKSDFALIRTNNLFKNTHNLKTFFPEDHNTDSFSHCSTHSPLTSWICTWLVKKTSGYQALIYDGRVQIDLLTKSSVFLGYWHCCVCDHHSNVIPIQFVCCSSVFVGVSNKKKFTDVKHLKSSPHCTLCLGRLVLQCWCYPSLPCLLLLIFLFPH